MKNRTQRCTVATCLGTFALLGASAVLAQQKVPLRNGIPVAPSGLEIPPLPDRPVYYKTAEGQDVRVVVLTRGLERPWSLAFLPGGDMLVTERGGRLRLVHASGELVAEPVAGTPKVVAAGLAGLSDVVLHPKFDSNHFVYLAYNKPGANDGATMLAIARGVWNGGALTRVEDVFVADPGTTGRARMAFGPDGMLYVATSGGDAQDPNTLDGKVLRLTDTGGVPKDNPFAGKAGYRPELYTLGHRSTLGLAFRPGTNELWQNENGPNGGDELNLLKPGANYGWPLVSLGRTYPGPWQSKGFSREGFGDPIVYWTPSIGVSGLAFYTGSKLPKWKGDVFVGALRTGEIPGTGHLERILFNENMEELRRESLLTDLRQRIRDVRMGPDELLYLLTDEDKGAILRIEPAN
jgi:aldose sugar dehydrogenase